LFKYAFVANAHGSHVLCIYRLRKCCRRYFQRTWLQICVIVPSRQLCLMAALILYDELENEFGHSHEVPCRGIITDQQMFFVKYAFAALGG